MEENRMTCQQKGLVAERAKAVIVDGQELTIKVTGEKGEFCYCNDAFFDNIANLNIKH